MKIKEIIITTFLSGIFGGMVALPVILIFQADIYRYLPLSAGIGILIGILARIVTIFFFYNIQKHPFPAFLSTALVIAFGTITGSILLGMAQILYIASMVCMAEIIGMTVSFIVYKYYLRLNQKLQETKKKFK